MSETISGVIEDIQVTPTSTGGKKFGIKLKAPNMQWPVNIGAFNDPQLSVGQTVTIVYKQNGKYKNYVSHTAGATAPAASSTAPAVPKNQGGGYMAKSFPIPALHPDRAIVRQNAATRAVDIVLALEAGALSDAEAAANRVVEIAQILENYYTGDLERKQAEALMAGRTEAGGVAPHE